MHEAKTTFSKLVRAAQAGDEVVVENHGKPVAKIVAYTPAPAQRRPGRLAGRIEIKPGFDEIPEGWDEAFS
jgi:prevent-host-death family protein